MVAAPEALERPLPVGRVEARPLVTDGDERETISEAVERLMGTRAESRFEFIQERAEFAREELLDV